MGVDSAPDGTPLGLTFASQQHFRQMCCPTPLRVFPLVARICMPDAPDGVVISRILGISILMTIIRIRFLRMIDVMFCQ